MGYEWWAVTSQRTLYNGFPYFSKNNSFQTDGRFFPLLRTMKSSQFSTDLSNKWLHGMCICLHLVQLMIFKVSRLEKLEDGLKMTEVFLSSQGLNMLKCSSVANHGQNNFSGQNLWEHLRKKIQPGTARYICIIQLCVHSDAQFIPPVPINRADTETEGNGRGKV